MYKCIENLDFWLSSGYYLSAQCDQSLTRLAVSFPPLDYPCVLFLYWLLICAVSLVPAFRAGLVSELLLATLLWLVFSAARPSAQHVHLPRPPLTSSEPQTCGFIWPLCSSLLSYDLSHHAVPPCWRRKWRLKEEPRRRKGRGRWPGSTWCEASGRDPIVPLSYHESIYPWAPPFLRDVAHVPCRQLSSSHAGISGLCHQSVCLSLCPCSKVPYFFIVGSYCGEGQLSFPAHPISPKCPGSLDCVTRVLNCMDTAWNYYPFLVKRASLSLGNHLLQIW